MGFPELFPRTGLDEVKFGCLFANLVIVNLGFADGDVSSPQTIKGSDHPHAGGVMKIGWSKKSILKQNFIVILADDLILALVAGSAGTQKTVLPKAPVSIRKRIVLTSLAMFAVTIANICIMKETSRTRGYTPTPSSFYDE